MMAWMKSKSLSCNHTVFSRFLVLIVFNFAFISFDNIRSLKEIKIQNHCPILRLAKVLYLNGTFPRIHCKLILLNGVTGRIILLEVFLTVLIIFIISHTGMYSHLGHTYTNTWGKKMIIKHYNSMLDISTRYINYHFEFRTLSVFKVIFENYLYVQVFLNAVTLVKGLV